MVNYMYLVCKDNIKVCDLHTTFTKDKIYKIVRKSDYFWTVLSDDDIRVIFSVQEIRRAFEPVRYDK